jgi:hypothetical protein
VSVINKIAIRELNIILLMSTGVIAAGVVIVYTNKHAHANWLLNLTGHLVIIKDILIFIAIYIVIESSCQHPFN